MNLRFLLVLVLCVCGSAKAQLTFSAQRSAQALRGSLEGESVRVRAGTLRFVTLNGLVRRFEYGGPSKDDEAMGQVIAVALQNPDAVAGFRTWWKDNQRKYLNQKVRLSVGDGYSATLEVGAISTRLTVGLNEVAFFGKDRHVLGKSGPIIREFSDFECPYCKKLTLEAMPGITEKFVKTGLARFSYRHFPLVNIHPQAMPAAIASECAGAQNKFWAFHDFLFARGLDFLSPVLELGLDLKKFQACRNDPRTKANVTQDMAVGEAAGVNGTPTLFVGPFRVENPYDLDLLSRLVRMASALPIR